MNSSLRRTARRALQNQALKREYSRIKQRVMDGVDPIKVGKDSTNLGNGFTYIRAQHGRYVIKDNNGVKDFVGISYRGSKRDMQAFAKILNGMYDIKIEPGAY